MAGHAEPAAEGAIGWRLEEADEEEGEVTGRIPVASVVLCLGS